MATYLFLADRTACGFQRMVAPFNAIKADPRYRNLDIKLVEPGDHAGLQAKVQGENVYGVTIPSDCDRVIIQRPTSKILVTCLAYMQMQGVHVAVDLDDDLLALHPNHPTLRYFRSLEGHSLDAVRTACQMADTFIASTPALAEKYKSRTGRTVVVRNRVPSSAFRVQAEGLAPHIGVPFAISTHPYDLGAVGNSLISFEEPVVITGPSPEDNVNNCRVKRLIGRDAEFTGEIGYDDWENALSRIHTAIAPLELSPFNTSKSALKCLQLSAAGVPFVKSPTPEYELLGAGLTADGNKPRAWKRQLKALLTDGSLRQDEIDRNRKIAEQNVYEDPNIVDEWLDAWLG